MLEKTWIYFVKFMNCSSISFDTRKIWGTNFLRFCHVIACIWWGYIKVRTIQYQLCFNSVLCRIHRVKYDVLSSIFEYAGQSDISYKIINRQTFLTHYYVAVTRLFSILRCFSVVYCFMYMS